MKKRQRSDSWCSVEAFLGPRSPAARISDTSAGGGTCRPLVGWRADGKSIRVDESPAYDDHYGDVALRQEFRFQGIEPGMLVSVRLGGKAYAWHELWSLSANGALTGAPGAETLVTGDDGVSAVKLTFEGSVPQGAAP